MAHAGGRPPKYKTAAELQKKIDEYFDSLSEDEHVTITGLVLYLGFVNRQTFYDLQENKKFSDTIKKARTRIEQFYEKNLTSQYVTGSIFALKQFGWSDVQKTEITGKDGGPITFAGISDDELRELITRTA